jgi:hypothetical protein
MGMYDWFPNEEGIPVGHGEFVARVAAGRDYGVAKNADLYIIKYKNAYVSPHSGRTIMAGAQADAIDEAFLEAISDALQTFGGVGTKAVINFSAGKLHISSRI